MDPNVVFGQATSLHQAGRIEEAAALYDQLLAEFPDHADTLQLRGAVEVQQGHFESALPWFDRALKVQPGLAAAYTNRAAAFIGLGRYEEALASAERAVELAPQSVASVNNLASVLNKLGRPDEALTAAGKALVRGVEDAALHIHRAESFMAGWRYGEVVEACDRAIVLDPNLPEAHGHRGHALTHLRRTTEASESFARALALSPNSAVGHYSRALALHYNHQPLEAIASCDRALALQPVFPEALIVRALALDALHRYAEAIAECDKALAIQPDSAEAYFARGFAYIGAKRPERALADLEVALELNPNLDLVWGQRAYLCLQISEWEGLSEKIDAVLAGVDAGRYVAQPLVMTALPSSPAQQLASAQRCFASMNPDSRGEIRAVRTFGEKLRVAYFSSDLHDHPVGQLLVGLLERHDRSRFEIVAFGFGGDPSNVTRRRIERACDHFVEAFHMNAPEMVAKAREMNLHIAVDLNGYTANLRTDVFAEGVAPIQVNYLGFPGTMGSERFHYIIGDSIVTPPEHHAYFSERIVTMPHSFLVTNEIKGHVPSRFSSRRDFGVPEEGFAFCSFNAAHKVTPEVFDIWMRLLTGVDGSFLWLNDHGPTATRNLRREAKDRGVSPDRLIFAPRTPGLEYLARYRAADLFLDTFDYNAHATGSEALMMGLPVVTRLGRAFAGRVGASLLTAIGLPELIASDSAAYEGIALELAREPERHKKLRKLLVENVGTYPLFDTARYARNLERAYTEMWRRTEQGLPPDHIKVVEQGDRP